jgi:hypothetical protein
MNYRPQREMRKKINEERKVGTRKERRKKEGKKHTGM